MIRLEHCSKLFGSVLALDDVTLELTGDGLVLVLGPNGSGKSTFLRMCAGLTTPSRGQIQKDQVVSYLGHRSMLYPQLTVRENLEFFSAVADSNFSENIDWLELDELLDKPVADLSQGQAARASLARALQQNSKALLLDEPSSAFDQRWRGLFEKQIAQLRRDRLLLVVTHDPELYFSLASRALIFSQGSLQYDFKAEDLTDRETFLARYQEVQR